MVRIGLKAIGMMGLFSAAVVVMWPLGASTVAAQSNLNDAE
jgi:hypothetical protein